MRPKELGDVPQFEWSSATLLAALTIVTLAGCRSGDSPPQDMAQLGVEAIDPATLLENTRVLASDEFQGRRPSTVGEERTVAFLTEQFQQLGLERGNPNGGWTQGVPLVGLDAQREASFVVNGRHQSLSFPDDYMAMTRRVTEEVNVTDSDMVFVGYGVVAPELSWDDYKDVDVTGKTIVMLVNDPDFANPSSSLFRGRAMTYYGRWTHKFEIATEKGAAAAVIIHETDPAGYPWATVEATWGGENLDIALPGGNMERVAVESWIQYETAQRLFSEADLNLDSLKVAAVRPDFRPVALNATANFRIRNQIREASSNNVIALLPGADPERRQEYVVYTAHWDHFGIGEPDASGDSIYSGALDNATGTAALIELARAFKALPQPPDRSVVFLAVTAEEFGLLGAKHYANQPLYPLEQTLANINIDGLNQWGPTNDIVVVGHGNTTLEDLLVEEAARQGRHVVPDPEPEVGYYYRSDHFEFAKQGVPALYTHVGIEYVGRPDGWGMEKRNEYIDNDYHMPSDEIKPDWDLSGGVQDIALWFRVGYRVANGESWPEWKEGTEFRARRIDMLNRN